MVYEINGANSVLKVVVVILRLLRRGDALIAALLGSELFAEQPRSGCSLQIGSRVRRRFQSDVYMSDLALM